MPSLFRLYFVDLLEFFGFVCHFGHLFIIIVCDCELSRCWFCKIFLLVFEIFSTICLLLSFQAYQKFVSAFDIVVLKKFFDGIVCYMINGACVDRSVGRTVMMGALQWEHVDRSIGTMFENCCWMNVILECF